MIDQEDKRGSKIESLYVEVSLLKVLWNYRDNVLWIVWTTCLHIPSIKPLKINALSKNCSVFPCGVMSMTHTASPLGHILHVIFGLWQRSCFWMALWRDARGMTHGYRAMTLSFASHWFSRDIFQWCELRDSNPRALVTTNQATYWNGKIILDEIILHMLTAGSLCGSQGGLPFPPSYACRCIVFCHNRNFRIRENFQ